MFVLFGASPTGISPMTLSSTIRESINLKPEIPEPRGWPRDIAGRKDSYASPWWLQYPGQGFCLSRRRFVFLA